MSKKIKIGSNKSVRKCGKCDACCVALTIDEPGIAKYAGVRCRHLTDSSGCGIYSTRPNLCRTWRCAWLAVPSFPEALRPDRSGVIMELNPQKGIDISIKSTDMNTSSAILNDDVLLFIANLIKNNKRVALSVPTKQGYCSYINLINEALNDVNLFDKRSMYTRISQIIMFFSQQRTDPQPILIHSES